MPPLAGLASVLASEYPEAYGLLGTLPDIERITSSLSQLSVQSTRATAIATDLLATVTANPSSLQNLSSALVGRYDLFPWALTAVLDMAQGEDVSDSE